MEKRTFNKELERGVDILFDGETQITILFEGVDKSGFSLKHFSCKEVFANHMLRNKYKSIQTQSDGINSARGYESFTVTFNK